jgi:hypothetical protein
MDLRPLDPEFIALCEDLGADGATSPGPRLSWGSYCGNGSENLGSLMSVRSVNVLKNATRAAF